MTATGNSATLAHRIGAHGRFHLRQPSGEITIHGVDGETVRVRDRDGRAIGDSFRVEQGEGSLSLVAPDKFGVDLLLFGIGRRASPDLEVEVPRGADVAIETASATLDASGLVGMTRLRTASGDVTLDAVGGILDLDDVSAEVSISANSPLDLRVRTISGDCAVRSPRLGRALIETTSGDVRVDAVLDGRGPFEIQTVSGDVTIVGRSGIKVEARTVTGDLRSDLPHRRDASPGRKQLIVGDGSVTVSFRSVSGDLRVVGPRDLLPAVPEAPAGLGAVQAPPIPPMPPVGTVPDVIPEPPVAPTDARENGREVSRLDILRALERGELSVEAAMARLAEIEGA